MPFAIATGVYTPPAGATSAAAGQVIQSATWNSIHTDLSTALSNCLTRYGNDNAETVIASAVSGTTDLSGGSTTASLRIQITGTNAITSLGTGANLWFLVRFAASLTLTYNAASLILPGAANIVTQAGDEAIFTSDATGKWRCVNYMRANGTFLGPAIAGYGTPTGGARQSSFAAGSITLANLAAAVAQLIVDLKTQGLLAA